MYNDRPPMSETQSLGSNLGSTEVETSSRNHQEQVPDTSSRVSCACENCIGNVGSPETPQPKANSWNRYNDGSQEAPVWKATKSQAASSVHNMDSQLPQSSYAWPVNEALSIQNPNISQPSSSNYSNPTRIYGNPILERQQRPTILVIVVNKPGLGKPNNGNAPGNYHATTTAGYPIGGYQNCYHRPSIVYNPTASYPIGGYQEGGYNSLIGTDTVGSPSSSQNNQLTKTEYDNGQNQIPPSGTNSDVGKLTNEPGYRNGSDSGQGRKQCCDNCTCTSTDRFDNKEGDEETFTGPSETDTFDCTCDMGDLEKTLESLIPNENCLCYLANMSNKKKKKKKKLRSVFDRFASPPFVIEPKPNCCMRCCGNRSCCCSCCNKCCNSCYPWY
ncbi:uncharacterized protein LOC117780210 isoform X2 [Drosophila innubila]|uniref:uncharacterized protein LOC117780210 isoform X2 n=1 Tax=Drosophila innubila TaxID=198719 RepID=UPI00148DD912|nr:uncharacterized protein LOC117780210 isoform X2 [Drosophila innubila]